MLALDGNEIVAPVRPEEVKVKFDCDYRELEKPIKTLSFSIR